MGRYESVPRWDEVSRALVLPVVVFLGSAGWWVVDHLRGTVSRLELSLEDMRQSSEAQHRYLLEFANWVERELGEIRDELQVTQDHMTRVSQELNDIDVRLISSVVEAEDASERRHQELDREQGDFDAEIDRLDAFVSDADPTVSEIINANQGLLDRVKDHATWTNEDTARQTAQDVNDFVDEARVALQRCHVRKHSDASISCAAEEFAFAFAAILSCVVNGGLKAAGIAELLAGNPAAGFGLLALSREFQCFLGDGGDGDGDGDGPGGPPPPPPPPPLPASTVTVGVPAVAEGAADGAAGGRADVGGLQVGEYEVDLREVEGGVMVAYRASTGGDWLDLFETDRLPPDACVFGLLVEPPYLYYRVTEGGSRTDYRLGASGDLVSGPEASAAARGSGDCLDVR